MTFKACSIRRAFHTTADQITLELFGPHRAVLRQLIDTDVPAIEGEPERLGALHTARDELSCMGVILSRPCAA